MRTAFTGHRPNKLYGYNYNDPRWVSLKNLFKKLLISLGCTEGIVGMALGVDTVAALAILELKDEGYDIKLHCAIPCLNQECKWPRESQRLYHDILDKADIVHYVYDGPYNGWCMQRRNEYMVDLLSGTRDRLIAVYDGTAGGTRNCVEYARNHNKQIILIDPKQEVHGCKLQL